MWIVRVLGWMDEGLDVDRFLCGWVRVLVFVGEGFGVGCNFVVG